MKLQLFIAAAVVLAMGACKTPYKATDKPRPATDSTASATDTSSAMNKMPVATDSANISKMDSMSKQLPDSAKMKMPPDSVQAKPIIDSARVIPALDSTKMQPTTDSVKAAPAVDSAAKSMEAPAAVEAVFTKQYPGATNVVWSNYDSLANIPIDMRLTGWKKT